MNDRTQHDVVSIGEAMLRLSAPTGKRLEVTESFMIHVGGAESNVVAALARLGHRCAWVSRLPNNAVGRLVTNQLRMAGVDLRFVAMQENGRVGIYYVEHGTPPRPTSVIYDRQGSSFSSMTAANIEWEVGAKHQDAAHDRNHAGPLRRHTRTSPTGHQASTCRWRCRQFRRQLPKCTLEPTGGEVYVAPVDGGR